MASLKLEHIYKVYPNGTKAVNDFSLDIKNGEFIVFVGPSGCGKSTTLRMIAGLEDITAGELYIDSDIVNDVEPKDRDIAMVFQNYALYPHMTVYENMAFGLRLRHVPDDIIQEKVLWAADILGIKDYLDRKPRNMSGGQRQRVSLGRAILRDPKVMLLDEPLSNLDAKLRASMRTEIAKLHQRLKTTFIYVTHDQTEAMTLGDRVVVMKGGRIQQVDTPKNLYNYPGNKFVAGFIGTPQMNFFDCSLKRNGDKVCLHLDINNHDINIDYNYLIKVLPEYLDGNHPLTLGIRCEHILLGNEGAANALPVKISHFEELGSECLIYGNLSDDVNNTDGQIIIRVKDVEGIEPNQTIYVKFDLNHIYFFDKKTENTIIPRIPEYNSLTASIQENKLIVLGHPFDLPTALKTQDEADSELQVPVDAVRFQPSEGLKAKIIHIETIGEVKLIHLYANNRVFFAKVNLESELKIDDIVYVDFDFTRLTFINQKKESIFTPMKERDSFYASFLNYETVIASRSLESFKEYRNERIRKAIEQIDEHIAQKNESYNKEMAELNSRDINKEYLDAYAKFKKQNDDAFKKIIELKNSSKTELINLKNKYLSDKKEAKEKNDKLFAEKKAKEIEEFKRFKEHNKDTVALKRRTDEYHIFKDNFHTEKENTLNLIINGLTIDYEAKSSAAKAANRRSIDLLKKEIAERNKKLKVLKNPSVSLTKKHNEEIKALEKKKLIESKHASFVFFFELPGNYYPISSDTIANKLVQGLGTRVFTKSFRIDMPHDAYTLCPLNQENSFKAKVLYNFDYGDVFYVCLSYIDTNGQEQRFYMKHTSALKEGSEVALTFDITKSQITETDMNIRLY